MAQHIVNNIIDDDNADTIRIEQERRLYQDFLRLNYRIFDRYHQLRDIFSFSVARTQDERAREEEELARVNEVLINIKDMILSLEKSSEPSLFSD